MRFDKFVALRLGISRNKAFNLSKIKAFCLMINAIKAPLKCEIY